MSELFEPIAIIGLGARLPGAGDPDEFWHNLVLGKNSITFPGEEELLRRGVAPADLNGSDYVRAASVISDVAGFDSDLFEISRRDAELCDPQIRLFLEMTHAALENAGYDPYSTGGDVGVFGTSLPSEYWYQNIRSRPDVVGDRSGFSLMTLNDPNYLATFVSYKLNLTGPSFTALSACSSSLVVLHLACQSLRLGECDMAVVGGANLIFPYGHGYRWRPGGIQSRDGYCRPLDAAASGTVFGSGAAALVLKPLSSALADGDHVRAVIKGIAVNNDGGLKASFGAPSPDGQAAAIAEAMALARVAPEEISYVEMHATGTLLGDPVEMSALNRAYQLLSDKPLEPGSCVVGSVKSNLGHLANVAGLASVIKVVLAFEHVRLPPMAGFATPNPRLNLHSTPFRIDERAESWERPPSGPRRAGVSSFGIGGTNAHAILEEAPPALTPRTDGRPRIVIWSARSEEAERQLRHRLGQFLTSLPEDSFADAAATLQQGRTAHRVRAAVVAAGAAEATEALMSCNGLLRGTAHASDPLVFAFPGMNVDDLRAARALYGVVDVFTIEADEIAHSLEQAAIGVHDIWRDKPGAASAAVTFLVQLALARTWAAWGLEPDAVAGEGDGQLAAAVVAGRIELDSATNALASGEPFVSDTLLESRIPCAFAAGPTATWLSAPHGDLMEAIAALPVGAPATALVAGSAAGGPAGTDVVYALGTAGADALRALLSAIGTLWVSGRAISWPALDRGRPVRKASLPGYPYQRLRAWVELPLGRPAEQNADEVSSPLSVLEWEERPATIRTGPGQGTALVLVDEGTGADLVLDALRAAGYTPHPVRWPRSALAAGGVAGAAAVLDRTLAELPAAGTPPTLLVHAVSVQEFGDADLSTVDDQLWRSFWALFLLARQAARSAGGAPEIVVVTSESTDVSGGEPLAPVKATLPGLVATLRRELSGQRCRLIDIGPRTGPRDLAAEFASSGNTELVALRSSHRWVRRRRALPRPDGDGLSLRPGGRYLITGGLGGLGLALADALAEVGARPELLFLQRRSGSGTDTATRLDALHQAGVSTRVISCDVSDSVRLEGAIAELVKTGGPLNGVFHLAGLPGGGLVRTRDPRDVTAVLAPKVHGTLALKQALDGHPELDFVVLFSSLAGIHGLMGSADYAAASSFQDAMAVVGGFHAKQVLTVDWPAWAEVGMAARSAVDVRMLSDGRLARAREAVPSKAPLNWQRRYSAAEHWFLDEHRLDGVPVLPGAALVGIILEAARDLDLVNARATVEDITFRVPVRVPRVVAVLIGFRPAGEALLVDVWHRPDPEGEDVEAAGWVHSAEARLSSRTSGPRPLSDGLSLLQDMEPSVVRPPITSRASRLSFGPRWNVVDAVWRVSDEEMYARLRLPDAFIADLNGHPLHPALLDMAAGLLAYWQPELFLPFRYRRITVHGTLGSELYVYVRVSERGERRIVGDLDLRAPDGTLLAELRGFSMLVTGQTAESAANARGLSPRAGTRILLDLLGRRTPPQILVSSPESGDAPETDDAPEPVAGDDAFGPLVADTPPAPAAPGGDGVQAGVREIWSTVLGSPVPDHDADFFEIGGDSLAAVEVLDLVLERYGTGLDADALFDASTVSEFAALIERARPR